MNRNLKFFTYIIIACFPLLPLKANTLTPPNYKEESNDKKVLAGLVIRHGEIIDALQPIYRPINHDGTLGEPYKGKQYGGNGGNRTEIYNDDYVIVGVTYEQGYWMGAKRLAGFSPIMQKWHNGRPTGDMVQIGSYGLVNKISRAIPYQSIPTNGVYIKQLEVFATDLAELGYNNDGTYVSNLIVYLDGQGDEMEQANIRSPQDGETFEVKQESPPPKSRPTNISFDINDSYYLINIAVTSGTKKGQMAKGIVSFPESESTGTATANRFILHYDGQCYTINDTGAPKADIHNGYISNLKVVAGPTHHRFGINGGFNRLQFGRYSERFIREGEEYFGYLHPNTIVDGAGTIEYQQIDQNVEEVYNQFLCD